jgi:hypothetical protein
MSFRGSASPHIIESSSLSKLTSPGCFCVENFSKRIVREAKLPDESDCSGQGGL